jgi:hypothetical protein
MASTVWAVFLALVLFAALLGALTLVSRATRAAWRRVAPVAGQTAVVIGVMLVLCALAGAVGWAIAAALA